MGGLFFYGEKMVVYLKQGKNHGGLNENGKKNTLDLMLFWKVIGKNSRLGIVHGPGEKSMSAEGMKKDGGMFLSP